MYHVHTMRTRVCMMRLCEDRISYVRFYVFRYVVCIKLCIYECICVYVCMCVCKMYVLYVIFLRACRFMWLI